MTLMDINLAIRRHVVHRVQMSQLVLNGSVIRTDGARAAQHLALAQILYRKAQLDIVVHLGIHCRL